MSGNDVAPAWVRIRDPEYDQDGQMFVDPELLVTWGRVAILRPSECDHGETMCFGCVFSWCADYEVHVLVESPDGGEEVIDVGALLEELQSEVRSDPGRFRRWLNDDGD